MWPGGGGGGERGCTAQDHTPATDRRDEDAPPHSTPPLPPIAPLASEEKKQKQEQEQPAASLPEGPLVEILSRVPYRSLCRFKCVSKPWLALCSSQDIRKRSPQTLSGFFYKDTSGLHFHNLSGRGPPLVDPSLSFLRESYQGIYVDQVCGGLLLCSCSKSESFEGEFDYVVCNPATEEWTMLPPLVSPAQEFDRISNAYLGFDAAVPSRFVVFTPLPIAGDDSEKVAIYSSETRQWSYVQSEWAPGICGDLDPCTDACLFLNGTMHWPTIYNSVVTVDSEGKVWREIKIPDGLTNSSDHFSVGQSQGRLYAWQRDDCRGTKLNIWVLEDYGTGKWTLTHNVNFPELLGRHCRKGDDYYEMFAVHPDCNVIFLTDEKKMTLSYNLDNHKVDVICTEPMYGLPYIPCFAELPTAGH